MTPSNTVIVIPARMASTRLPGKVLRRLGGLPVVEWCRRAAVRARCGEVVVATDAPEVRRAIEGFGGAAVMTSTRCRSGTDRVHAAVCFLEKKRGRRFDTVINLQGDEPFIRPATIRAVARLAGRGGDISTAVVPLKDKRDGQDPNRVKTAMTAGGRCLYFSRSPIPYDRTSKAPPLLQHIGIYGFTRDALDRFVRLRPSRLEGIESLEQLRALEAGMTILGARVQDPTLAIDTAGDLKRAQKRLTPSPQKRN